MMSMNTPSSSTSSPSWMIPSSLLRSQKPSKLQSWCCRVGSHPPFSNSGSNDNSNFDFVLHTALDSLSIDTTHARDAREGFRLQIEKLSAIERETSITINRCVDLAKTALFIAAEDDSLISHSSVPLPVDAFIDRLDDLSMGYCSSYSSSLQSSPEKFLHSLEDYLYGKKGFRRSNMSNLVDQRALYLHSVLTHRSGSAVMLSLIYSEILKMLRLWGLVDFDCEIFYPHDNKGLPTGYLKQKSRESDQPHIMTSQTLLEEILRNLKEAFWPFQTDDSKSLFLRAARAADCIDRSMIIENSGFQLASAKAAQHRLDRGVWTSVKFGDMRRALSACERLILLRTDPKELRDYSILLYHCGFYDQSLQYLKMYQESKGSSVRHGQSDTLSSIEEDALGKLTTRLKLILMEEGWSKPSHVRNFLGNKSEPW